MAARERQTSIRAYCVKKAELKVLAVLKHTTRLIVRRRLAKKRGKEYRHWQLKRRALEAMARWVHMKKTMKTAATRLRALRRIKRGPEVIDRMRLNALGRREERLKR